MKKILILALLLSLFACDKNDNLSAKYSKEEILNAVAGTWKFNRLAYDPEFKNILKIPTGTCKIDAYITLNKNETFTSTMVYCDSIKSIEEGTLAIDINKNSEVYIWPLSGGLALTPNTMYNGPQPLYSFTDSTLIFSEAVYYSKEETENDKYHLYSELKRIK